ncbi:MAG: polysaccharide biosynthesis tyrosine autokinase [Firmicutes bacterium]|nr:polysaccharide biosynthesis tyrosine autokinase [Bacillota bacterium]
MAADLEQEEINFDIIDILNIIKKRLGLVLVIIGMALTAGVVFSLLTPPTYQAVATLRIKQPKGLVNSLLSETPLGNVMYTEQMMYTYAEILTSRTVVEEVIKKTQKGKDKPAFKDMIKRIATQPVKGTEILKIRVAAQSPEEAAKVANTLINTFLERLTHLERSEQASVREFIGEQLEQSKKELSRAEQELENYKQTQKILTPGDQTKALVERFAQIDRLAAENKLNIATAQAKLDNAKSQLAQEKSELVADNSLITQYRSKLAEREIKLVNLLEKYTEKHPEVMATRAEIEETRSKLNEELVKIINYEAPSLNPIHQSLLQSKLQAEAEISAAKAQQEAIFKIQAANEMEIMKLPAKEQGLTRLMRDASVAQEIYIMLAKRFEEARISEVMQPTDVQVIDPAVAPEQPVKPNKKMNVLLAGAMGLFCGIGVAFVLEYLWKTIDTVEDVKHYLGLQVLEAIPDFQRIVWKKGKQRQRSKQQLAGPELFHASIAEAYRKLRTSIQLSEMGGNLKTLLFTSSGPGEGKSVTAANLGVVMAHYGKRVVIVDCDLRNPGQHQIFGKRNQGLTDILVKGNSLPGLIQPTEVDNLDLLAGGIAPPNPSELLGSARMMEIIAALKSQYDYVLFDAPPVLAVTDACVLASRADGVILVIGAGMVRPAAARDSKELLIKARGELPGVVLNKALRRRDQHLHYHYYYS